ncbi:MAG: 6,7-dimethyl-8-ribityllumazine synthase [Phycisphaerales bacterium]|nr:6,7-dimethyl-8-ribityllumazine synthase [Phycisphaerales bacterium]
MRASVQPDVDARGLRIGVVTSQYHDAITSRLLSGAQACFLAAGGTQTDLLCIEAPGSYELISIARTLASRPDLDAIVCLGCVLTGETRHDEYICEAVANGLAHISATSGKPVAFGVLTCPSIEHAEARAGGAKGNKGAEAMRASIAAAQSIQAILELPLGRASR